MIVPTLIVAFSALLAVTIVRHPSAELIALRAKLRGKEVMDDIKDDGGRADVHARGLFPLADEDAACDGVGCPAVTCGPVGHV